MAKKSKQVKRPNSLISEIRMTYLICATMTVIALISYYYLYKSDYYEKYYDLLEWGPSSMMIAVLGVLSVLVNCWFLIDFENSCLDYRYATDIAGIILTLIAHSIPLSLALHIKIAAWQVVETLIISVFLLVYSFSCLNFKSKALMVINIVWLLYLFIWLGSVNNWNLFNG